MTCLNLKCTVCQSTKHVMGSMWEVVWVLRHRWQNYQQQHPLYNLIWLPIFHHTHPQSPRQPPQAILSQTWNSLSHHNLKTRSAVAWHCMGKYKDYSSVRLSLTFNGWPRAFLTVSQIYIFILRHAWVAIKLNKLHWIGLIFGGKVCLGSVRSKSYSAAEVLPVKRAIVLTIFSSFGLWDPKQKRWVIFCSRLSRNSPKSCLFNWIHFIHRSSCNLMRASLQTQNKRNKKSSSIKVIKHLRVFLSGQGRQCEGPTTEHSGY